MPVPVPGHLPAKLTITLWDFTWYTRTGPGEPFADLDAAFLEAAERGYNTVRICAMPFLLFGSGLDTTALRFTGLGADYAQRTRWYDIQADSQIDGRAHLLELFRAAQRHDFFVIVSSWEYQQSSAFLDNSSWADALMAVEPERRPVTLAEAYADLVTFLESHGVDDRIAFIEIHNEVQGGHLTDDLPAGSDLVVGLHDRLADAVDMLHGLAPDRLVAMNYSRVPVGSMRGIPTNVDVVVFHPYVYGALGELYQTFALRDADQPFPQDQARELLRPDAPAEDEWLPDDPEWRLTATIVPTREVYFHDWCDPIKFDRWLYSRYTLYAAQMRETMHDWIRVATDWGAAHGVPVVYGEGWVGYTPLHSEFEGGPVGAQVCRDAVRLAGEHGAWGAVVCSNAAPHHPMWADVSLQVEINENFKKEGSR
jgi:hypothetical protein